MTYYQLIRLCLLLDAAGMAGLSETIKNVLGNVNKKEGEKNAKSEGADAGK